MLLLSPSGGLVVVGFKSADHEEHGGHPPI